MAAPDFPERPSPLNRDPNVPKVIVSDPEFGIIEDKMPEHRVMAEAVQQVAAAAAVQDTKRGPSAWLLVIAFILALFMLAMFLLAAVVSTPGPAGS